MKCMKKCKREDHTRRRKINLGRKSLGNEVGVRDRCLGRRKDVFCRER